jgi:Beta-fructosidases (levanase/invertase)
MKQLIILAMMVILGMNHSYAQQTEFLSDNRVIQRITTEHKYLLLPVEESQENDHIRVIQNNKVVKELNCRLAINKTDYLVPLALDDLAEGEAALYITMNRGNATAPSGGQLAIRDFVCWKQMQYSDTFDTRNREKFRPVYHHTPLWGWMNDPNGMFYKDGVWHLYFQHNPYGSQWENMTWGHSTSRDLIHWTFEGEAVEPDAWGTIFSGSSVVDKHNTAGWGEGTVVAFYTAAEATQKQCMAYSTDNGKTFVKYDKNPILTSEVADFRDPHVFWNEDAQLWNMVLAEKQHMKIYSSKNLKDWTFESDFGEGYGNHDGVWECPDLMKIGDKWLLICNINPGGPFGGSATQYFVGSFDGHRFVCEDAPEETKWMDWGKDHYATVTFDNAPDGRHVAMPWMSNWQYANQVPTKQFRSANGLPRDLGLFSYEGETYCSVKPSREVLEAFAVKPSGKLTEACRIDVQPRANTVIKLSNDKGDEVTMIYDAKNETFSMDRTKSGDVSFSNEFAAVTKAPTRGKIKTLQIFIDRSSIEVMDAEGKMAMSNLVFSSMPYNKLTVKGGSSKIYPLK